MIDWDEFLILNYLDIFKSSCQKDIERDTTLDKEKIEKILTNFSKRGLVRKTDEQWQIEPTGEEEIKRLRYEILGDLDKKEKVLSYCREFEDINKRFKDLVTRWQVKNEDGMLVPNDHTDPEYDLAIIEELNAIHKETIELLKKMSAMLPILELYIVRFNRALNFITDGKIEYLSDLDYQSYHGIWFELHETLLKLSGLKRIE